MTCSQCLSGCRTCSVLNISMCESCFTNYTFSNFKCLANDNDLSSCATGSILINGVCAKSNTS